MGHKVHPNGFRLGVSRTWNAKWYADRDYTDLLKEDMSIRALVGKRLANASVSLVEIERGINHVTVTVHTAKPGIVIGKGGANVESLRQAVGKLTTRKVKLEIKEIRQPELDVVLVASNIAQQLTRRFAFRKVHASQELLERFPLRLDQPIRSNHLKKPRLTIGWKNPPQDARGRSVRRDRLLAHQVYKKHVVPTDRHWRAGLHHIRDWREL